MYEDTRSNVYLVEMCTCVYTYMYMYIYIYGFQAGKDTFTVSALRGLPNIGGPSVGVPVTSQGAPKGGMKVGG